jgi:hypothetical protein
MLNSSRKKAVNVFGGHGGSRPELLVSARRRL